MVKKINSFPKSTWNAFFSFSSTMQSRDWISVALNWGAILRVPDQTKASTLGASLSRRLLKGKSYTPHDVSLTFLLCPCYTENWTPPLSPFIKHLTVTDSFIFFHGSHCIKMELLLHGVLREHRVSLKGAGKNLHKSFICQDMHQDTPLWMISNF